MTVCIAARADTFIVLASDRMITQDNVQYEPARLKIYAMTNSIFVMTSGDASLSARILGGLHWRVQAAITAQPDVWLTVKDVADWYVEEFNKVRTAEAEAAILAPFGLTTEQFLARQVAMDTTFVERLTTRLIDFPMSRCEAIIAGRDPTGSHVYSVDGTTVDVHDTIGFAAVGIGARHAISHLMHSRHTWNARLNDAVVRTFVAKRRAEVAPGVGKATDMVVIGEALGHNVVVGEAVIERLDIEYEKMIAAEQAAEEAARRSINEYISGAEEAAPDQQKIEEPAPPAGKTPRPRKRRD